MGHLHNLCTFTHPRWWKYGIKTSDMHAQLRTFVTHTCRPTCPHARMHSLTHLPTRIHVHTKAQTHEVNKGIPCWVPKYIMTQRSDQCHCPEVRPTSSSNGQANVMTHRSDRQHCKRIRNHLLAWNSRSEYEYNTLHIRIKWLCGTFPSAKYYWFLILLVLCFRLLLPPRVLSRLQKLTCTDTSPSSERLITHACMPNNQAALQSSTRKGIQCASALNEQAGISARMISWQGWSGRCAVHKNKEETHVNGHRRSDWIFWHWIFGVNVLYTPANMAKHLRTSLKRPLVSTRIAQYLLCASQALQTWQDMTSRVAFEQMCCVVMLLRSIRKTARHVPQQSSSIHVLLW